VPKVDQIAFDAAGELLYCAGADKMSVARTSGGKVVALGDLPTAATAKNVAVDPLTRAYGPPTPTERVRSPNRGCRPNHRSL